MTYYSYKASAPSTTLSQSVALDEIMHSVHDIVLACKGARIFSSVPDHGADNKLRCSFQTCSLQPEAEHYPCTRPNTLQAIKRRAMIKYKYLSAELLYLQPSKKLALHLLTYETTNVVVSTNSHANSSSNYLLQSVCANLAVMMTLCSRVNKIELHFSQHTAVH